MLYSNFDIILIVYLLYTYIFVYLAKYYLHTGKQKINMIFLRQSNQVFVLNNLQLFYVDQSR